MIEFDEREVFQSLSLPTFISKLKSPYELFDESLLNQWNTECKGTLKVFIIGFACDQGAQNCLSRTGAEKGPSSFREIFEQLKTSTNNAFYQVNLSEVDLKIYDCGDVKNEHQDMEKAHEELYKIVKQIISSISNSKIILIGGTDDQLLPVIKAFGDQSQEKVNLINIDPQIDMKSQFKKQFDELEPTFHEHHQSHFRMIYEDKQLLSKIENIIFFGLHGYKISMKNSQFVQSFQSPKAQLVYLDKDIRKKVKDCELKETYTQAGNKIHKIIESLDKKPLLCNIDLSSIKSDYFPGVSEPFPSYGLSIQEAEEIAFILGQQNQVRILSLTEYNPAIEKYHSGTIVNNIFQSFLFGIGRSLQNQ